MKPNDVTSDKIAQHLRNTVYNYQLLIPPPSKKTSAKLTGCRNRGAKITARRQAQFKVGDHVRISKYKMIFDKSYNPQWTTEIFKVRAVQYNTEPITYLLSDYEGHDIKGSLYAEELQLVKHPDVYLVEKILKRKNDQVYVKWYGMDRRDWVSKDAIL